MRELLRSFLNPMSILGAIAFAGILFLASVFLLIVTRPGPTLGTSPTAVMAIIQAPTATSPPPTPTPYLTPTPSDPVPPAPPEGTIAVGAYVQIAGTGGDGLRMRLEPGLQGRVLFVGLESEVFIVSGGPQQLDDYTWWYLVAPFEEDRQGWAVSNYLSVVQNP